MNLLINDSNVHESSKVVEHHIKEPLILHIANKLSYALESYEIESDIKSKLSESLMNALTNHKIYSLNNKCFMETGILISKAIVIYKIDINKYTEHDTIDIDSIITKYNTYLADSKQVYDNIQSHHQNIMHYEWSNVTKNKESLAIYSNAASTMGNKIWVAQSIEWITDFTIKYYYYGGAKKYYLKKNIISNNNNIDNTNNSNNNIDNNMDNNIDTNSIDNKNLLNMANKLIYSNKIRLLDVGSCYNPINKSKSCDYFDITAVDLYPADNSVLQCDFLNLNIGIPNSKPIIDDNNNNNSCNSINNYSSSSNNNININSNTLCNETDISICHQLKKQKTINHQSQSSSSTLIQLPSMSFDVIVMSLVLSYLPTPNQRELMIKKARQLLISPTGYNNNNNNNMKHYNGLLLIIEKQSIFNKIKSNNNNNNNNNNIIDKTSNNEIIRATTKEWIKVIENIGFQLLRYENYLSKDKRKSHIFIFSTIDIISKNNISMDSISNNHERLWIKQDFDIKLKEITL